jgi:hypothetical protein
MSVPSQQRIWILAGGGAAIGGLLILMLFRIPDKARLDGEKPSKPTANVGLSMMNGGATDSLLHLETTLRDPTPLFLPTPWNAGEIAMPSQARREPGGSFQGYSPKPMFAEAELQLALPSPVAVPRTPAGIFALGQASLTYWGFGQVDQPIRPLPPRGAFVEILGAGDGHRRLAQPLADAQPPGEQPWQPLQFLVAVDAIGVVGPPVLTVSSRVAAVDGYFQSFLVGKLHIGELLGPGFYRISIGP